MRMLKGKLRIELTQTGFAYDDPITGKITILAKKPIESTRLLISLIAEETRRYRDRDNNDKRETREVFRNEVVLAGSKSYSAQETDEISFSIPGAPRGMQGAMQSGDSGGMPGTLGTALKMGLQAMTGDRREVDWKLVARLDCPGLDLVHSQVIHFM